MIFKITMNLTASLSAYQEKARDHFLSLERLAENEWPLLKLPCQKSATWGDNNHRTNKLLCRLEENIATYTFLL